MNAIILSAGKGTRLRSETISIPKGMVKLFDKSLLEMQIDVFKKCSINDISIVTGYLADKITFPSINYFKNENFSSTAGNESIFCAREKLQDCTIITYGDLVFEKAVIDQVIDFKGDIGIAVDLDWEKNYVNRDQHPKSEAENILINGNEILEIRKNISAYKENEKIERTALLAAESYLVTALFTTVIKTMVGRQRPFSGEGADIFKGPSTGKNSFPSMPKKFWNDKNNIKYKGAYFKKYKKIWHHGDYAERKKNGGYIIYGRSDATLNQEVFG